MCVNDGKVHLIIYKIKLLPLYHSVLIFLSGSHFQAPEVAWLTRGGDANPVFLIRLLNSPPFHTLCFNLC